MAGKTQAKFKHEVPKEPNITQPPINLTSDASITKNDTYSLLHIEVNLRRGAILNDVFAFKFHLKLGDSCPLKAAKSFRGLCYRVLCSFRETFFGYACDVDYL